MAFPWVAAAMLASSALGAYGSKEAADAAQGGRGAGVREQQRQYNAMLGMLEPQRGLGYGALSDLASLYGYGLPAYAGINTLISGGTTGPGAYAPIAFGGKGGGGGGGSMSFFGKGPSAMPAGQTAEFLLGMGGDKSPVKGTIDPTTGTVSTKSPRRSDLLTNYLRTGEWSGGKGGRMRQARSAIDQLRASGWTYQPGGTSATSAQQPGIVGPGSMDRFFTSPDYEFRRQEGTRGIEQGAAARGGALSGNALRAVTGYGSNLAAGEYGNYVNRLMQMAGLGSAATTTGVQAGQGISSNIADLLAAQGDARASGIMGVSNAVGNAANNYMLWQLLNQQRGA